MYKPVDCIPIRPANAPSFQKSIKLPSEPSLTIFIGVPERLKVNLPSWVRAKPVAVVDVAIKLPASPTNKLPSVSILALRGEPLSPASRNSITPLPAFMITSSELLLSITKLSSPSETIAWLSPKVISPVTSIPVERILSFSVGELPILKDW